MTVYVDDSLIPATVNRISSRWSHLFADTQDELHAFAQSIGLRRSWFQPGKPFAGQPSRLWHYDVTEGKRRQAIAAGARPVAWRDAVQIMKDRDARAQEEQSHE